METFADIALDVLKDAVLDTLYLIPFLLVVYLLMEWLEHKAGEKTQESVRRAGAAGPFVGALLGVVPQCGFSAAAATLYAGRVITFGTLMAVFLATSDEMLPIFIAQQVPFSTIALILGAKVLIGMVMGFIIDATLHLLRRDEEKLRIHELCEQDHCDCNGECAHCHENPELAYGYAEDHEHHHDHSGSSILKSALKHTAQVTLFVFIVSLLINAALALVGEEALASFVSSNEVISIFAAALVGLIPNCAASVAIAQLYVEGVLGAGAMMAGLLVSAGVGLLVLARANRRPAQNAQIVGILWAVGVVWGLIISAFGIAF
ncbi:MAG: putative manganese transporter [Coriobacteriia bacterium]|nr:putative manganese transporter [Coriobacteriia bacterium]